MLNKTNWWKDRKGEWKIRIWNYHDNTLVSDGLITVYLVSTDFIQIMKITVPLCRIVPYPTDNQRDSQVCEKKRKLLNVWSHLIYKEICTVFLKSKRNQLFGLKRYRAKNTAINLLDDLIFVHKVILNVNLS